jgi:hypothetical protein
MQNVARVGNNNSSAGLLHLSNPLPHGAHAEVALLDLELQANATHLH